MSYSKGIIFMAFFLEIYVLKNAQVQNFPEKRFS